MPSTEEKIEDFCNYFLNQAQVIGELAVDPAAAQGTDQERHQIRFYKKTLIITHIDTLAGIRYTEKRYPQLNKRNRERFIQFIETSNSWPNGSMVSIPFLAEYANGGKITDGQLKEHVLAKLAANFEEESFNVRASVIDESLEQLMALSSTEQEEKAIRESRHYELMYRYRNYLIHESQEPGNAMEVVPENEAYYHGYIGEQRLFLAYPLQLFESILEQSITYLKNYLLKNEIDPYAYVKETARW